MKTKKCEKCRKRNATVFLTIIGPSAELSNHQFCETCHAGEKQCESKDSEPAKPAVVTPAPAKPTVLKTVFGKKLKSGGRKPEKREIPAGVWTKCEHCATMLVAKDLKDNLEVCPHCLFHFRLGARERIQSLVEAGSFEELDADMMSVDMLNFTSTATYKSKLAEHQAATGLKDAAVTGIGKIGEHRAGLGVLDFGFLGGSMGSVMGEKLARLVERCTEEALPVIIISASGGARMHEGMFSLTQMAKTCAVLQRYDQANLAYISVLTDPTIGGVLASFASLGGLNIAEPGAKIGLTGARVIKEAIHKELPEGFQTAEFLLERGLIDAIVSRKELKKRLIDYLDFMTVGGAKAVAAG